MAQSSLLQLLLSQPSGAEKLMSLLPLLQGAGGSSGFAPLGGDTTTQGTTVYPGGPTDYKYQTFEKPYSGTPGNLVTRQGVTLQRGPMRSLIEIARQSKILPGIQEIGQIGQGYRTAGQQAGMNPATAAPVGQSYHQQGLAMDAGWWSDHARLARALAQAGWNQFSPSGEPWHWSYGVTG